MVEIRNLEQLRRWLDNKPLEWSRIIAVRTALRVVPLLAPSSGVAPDWGTAVILPSLRAIGIACVAVGSAADALKLRVPASRAFNAASAAAQRGMREAAASRFRASINAAHSAAFAASRAAEVVARYRHPDSADSTTTVASAAVTATRDSFDGPGAAPLSEAAMAAIWQAIEIDAGSLEGGKSAVELAGTPLWGGMKNRYIDENLDAMRLALSRLGGYWDIWQLWYESHFDGLPSFGLPPAAAKEIDLRIALQDDEWWERDAAEVNADIAAWVEAARALVGTYNLLVHGSEDAWGRGETTMPRGRVLTEYTAEDIQAAFRRVDAASVAPLLEIPTLFAYESGVDLPARVGRIIDVGNGRQGFDLRVEFDPSWKPISAEELRRLRSGLGFGHLEEHRTHWAVKKVDLFEVLRREGYSVNDKNAGERKQHRPTIADFILDFLEESGRPVRIEEIAAAFEAAEYPVIPKSMRGALSDLAIARRVNRLERGLYEIGPRELDISEREKGGFGRRPPVVGVASPYDYGLSEAGQITVVGDGLASLVVPNGRDTRDAEHRLETGRQLAADLAADLADGGFQVRASYAKHLRRYAERLPSNQSGNIYSADAEARTLRDDLVADLKYGCDEIFARRLARVLEQHYGLRVYFSDLLSFYDDVRHGEVTEPPPLQAFSRLSQVVGEYTPDVFNASVSASLQEVEGPLSREFSSSTEGATDEAERSEIALPPDPIADIDPARVAQHAKAGIFNRIWGILLKLEDGTKVLERGEKVVRIYGRYIEPVLDWLTKQGPPSGS